MFGLITTTREWYQSDEAIRRFRNYAIATLAIWLFFLFLHYRPAILEALQASIIGSAIILFLGMILAFTFFALLFGMGWYFWRLDSSERWIKLLGLVTAFVLSPFVEVAYFVFVYRPQVMRTRTSN